MTPPQKISGYLGSGYGRIQKALFDLAQSVDALVPLARQDPLTPLLNDIALEADGEEFMGETCPQVVVFGDSNRLKSLNVHFGHETASAAITHIGSLIQLKIVQGCQGIAYRKSGDEFVFLLQKNALSTFLKTASTFADCPFLMNGKSVSTSMSFGYVVSDGNTGFRDLVNRAEAACAVAKAEGNGTCVEWKPGMQKTAGTTRRHRCALSSCNITFTAELSADKASATLYCPACQTEVV